MGAIAWWILSPYPFVQWSIWTFSALFGSDQQLPGPLKWLARLGMTGRASPRVFLPGDLLFGVAEVSIPLSFVRGLEPTEPVVAWLEALHVFAFTLWLIWLTQLYWHQRRRAVDEGNG